MTTVLLSTTYFGPIQWYQKLYRADSVVIDNREQYQKQSFRNRCEIAAANGRQTLTMPVEHAAESKAIGNMLISNHGRWQHQHWQSLQSAYGDSPFFFYYADDLLPFFKQPTGSLFDFNMNIVKTICQLLDISPNISTTPPDGNDDIIDLRNAIHPKHPAADNDFVSRRYYQVFQERYGFLPNLSILDLLFCCGPESVLYL